MSERQEQDSEDRRDWKDDAAVEAGCLGLEATGCCLLSLLNAVALLLLPVSALLVMIR